MGELTEFLFGDGEGDQEEVEAQPVVEETPPLIASNEAQRVAREDEEAIPRFMRTEPEPEATPAPKPADLKSVGGDYDRLKKAAEAKKHSLSDHDREVEAYLRNKAALTAEEQAELDRLAALIAVADARSSAAVAGWRGASAPTPVGETVIPVETHQPTAMPEEPATVVASEEVKAPEATEPTATPATRVTILNRPNWLRVGSRSTAIDWQSIWAAVAGVIVAVAVFWLVGKGANLLDGLTRDAYPGFKIPGQTLIFVIGGFVAAIWSGILTYRAVSNN